MKKYFALVGIGQQVHMLVIFPADSMKECLDEAFMFYNQGTPVFVDFKELGVSIDLIEVPDPYAKK